MGVRTKERGLRVGFIHAGASKALRCETVAHDFQNQFMQVSQAVHAALLADPVAVAWAGSLKGQAGVLVSAGPSLSKNAHVLADKIFLDRFVMVATAAAAGSLRAMELRPQLVASTHELSDATRQWLGSFNANSVRAVLDSSLADAGVVIPSPAGVVDSLLGYVLLRYLGCDPVILVGFDLAFIDGVAHAKGNELDLQWSTQISPVRSWDWWHTHRILGNSTQLQRETLTNETGEVAAGASSDERDDVGERHERSVVTNLALRSERALLEAAFAHDVALGLRVIDATEGGVVKRHAVVEPLAQCLATCATARNAKV